MEHLFAGVLAVVNSSRCPYEPEEEQLHPHKALGLQSTGGRQPSHPRHCTHGSPMRAAPLTQSSHNWFQPAPQPCEVQGMNPPHPEALPTTAGH